MVVEFSPMTFLIATQSVSGPSAEPTDNSDGGFCGRGTCLLEIGSRPDDSVLKNCQAAVRWWEFVSQPCCVCAIC